MLFFPAALGHRRVSPRLPNKRGAAWELRPRLPARPEAEMPLSSQPYVCLNIPPVLMALCTQTRRWRDVVFVYLTPPPHPPPSTHLWGRRWKTQSGCEAEVVGWPRGSGRSVDRRGRGPSDDHTHTHTHSHRVLVPVRAAVFELSQAHGTLRQPSPRRCWISSGVRPVPQPSPSQGLSAQVLTCLTWGQFWNSTANHI